MTKCPERIKVAELDSALGSLAPEPALASALIASQKSVHVEFGIRLSNATIFQLQLSVHLANKIKVGTASAFSMIKHQERRN